MSHRRCLADAVAQQARNNPDLVALIVDGQVMSYAELDQASNRVAHALLSSGLPTGSRIGLLAANHRHFFSVWHGASKAGYVLAPINARLAPPEVAYVVNDTEAPLLLVDDAHQELVESIRSELRHVEAVVSLDEATAGFVGYEQWQGGQSDSPPQHTVDPDDTVIQLYTSGTTGRPKGVELSHAAVLHCVRVMMGTQAWPEGQVSLVTAPLFHTAGCAWTQCALQSASTAVLLTKPAPGTILRAIEENQVTQALLVPAVINMIVQSPDSQQANLNSLNRILYGASPIPVPVLRKAVELFDCDFDQGYGLTETVGPVVVLGPEDHRAGAKLASCGKTVAGMRARVANADGIDCKVGEVGEILIAGPQVMRGYWKQPEATNSVLQGEWLHTGDAGYFDGEGYLYVHDRLKDMIVSGGENVYPAEIESALADCEGVADVAVIGVPDPKWGEAVMAIVVANPGSDLAPSDLIEFAHTRLANYKCPKSVDFVSTIPRNAAGKILKRKLREPYWAGLDRKVN